VVVVVVFIVPLVVVVLVVLVVPVVVLVVQVVVLVVVQVVVQVVVPVVVLVVLVVQVVVIDFLELGVQVFVFLSRSVHFVTHGNSPQSGLNKRNNSAPQPSAKQAVARATCASVSKVF